MKHDYKLLLALIAALGLPLACDATTLTEAQITSIVKDVKTIDPGKGARPAALKETLQGEQAVRTGIESRSELLFNDHTITRLGANTHFSFTEGTRNMSLDSGVMLLQVPKGIGGAKIQTAAVTAAVTGTTIMVEAGADYTKLIVLEGECCLWPRNKKIEQSPLQSKLYRMHHEVCAEAGQEIILRNGAKDVPDPVYVNLKTLEATALLLNGNWGATLNSGPINAAAAGQGNGNYNPTNLAIIGAGTDVVVIQEQDPQGPPNPGTPPPGGGGGSNPSFTPPGKYGPLITITSGNPYTIGAGSAINTDPRITTNGVTDYGRIYRGTTLALDGSPDSFFFGPGFTNSGLGNNLDLAGQTFPDYGIAAFKFTNLVLSAVPAFNVSTNGANDMVLISEGNIDINANGTLDFTPLNDLAFGTVGGNISLEAGTTIQGLTGFLGFYNLGAQNNINIDGVVNLPNGSFFAHTQGSFGTSQGTGVINAQTIDIKAGGLVTLDENTFSSFADFANFDDEGGTTIDTVNGVQVASSDDEDATTLSSLTLTGNGISVPDGFSPNDENEGNLVDLTLNSFSNGILSGTIFLSGYISVDSLNATADSDITTDTSSSIYSNSVINLTSNGGNITTGPGSYMSANSAITFNAAGDITTNGSVNVNNNGGSLNNSYNYNNNYNLENSIQFTSGGGIDVEDSVAVNNNCGTLTFSNNNVTLSSNESINTGNFVQLISNGGTGITVNGSITINNNNGSLNFSNNTVALASGASINTGNFIQLVSSSDILVNGSIAVNSSDQTLCAFNNNVNLGSGASINTGNFIQLTANGGSVTTGDQAYVSAGFVQIMATGDADLDGSIDASTLTISGNNINTLSSEGSSSITATTSINFNAADTVTLDGNISAPMITGTAVNSVTIPSTAFIHSGTVAITASYVQLDGDIRFTEAGGGPSLLSVNTTGGNNPVLDNGQDFFSSGGTGEVDPQILQVQSGGDLDLEGSVLNGISINPFDYLQELDLSGATVEINGNPASNILTAISTGGPVTIGTSLTPADEFSATAGDGNQIIINGEGTTISSGTVILAANEIINNSSASTLINVTGNNGSLSLSVGTDGIFSQSSASTFTFVQTLAGSPIASGALPFSLTSGSTSFPTVSISAGSLTVSGTIDASSYGSFTLNLTAANDINGGETPTSAAILGATTVSLNVGVGATLTGDATLNTIDYNGAQLIIDNSRLGGLSLSAPSILVNDDGNLFPEVNGSLTLASSGSGGVTTDTNLNITDSANFTANGGGAINVNNALTAGSIMLATDTGAINVSGEINSTGNVTINAGNGISITGDLGDYNPDDEANPFTPIGGSVALTANNGDISVTSPDVILTDGGFSATASNGNITLGNLEEGTYISIGAGLTLAASGTISITNDVTLNGPLSITAGSDILATGESAIFSGATDVTLALTGAGAILSESSDSTMLNFGGAGDSVDNMIAIDLTGATVTSVTASGASITLSGSFNVPVPLTLNATNGTLAVSGSGSVYATSFTGNSTNGDIDIGEPVTTGAFSAIASNGDLNINAPVNALTFGGTATNITIDSVVTGTSSFYASAFGSSTSAISGTGTVTSPNVTLLQGGTANVSQSVSQAAAGDELSFNTLNIVVSDPAEVTSTLSLQGGPLNFSTALALTGVDLTLAGTVQTNGNSISAMDVTLSGVSTTTDGSGNATGLSVSGSNNMNLYGTSLDGAGGTHGNGGVLTATALNLNVDLGGFITAQGGSTGSAGGNGGTINLTANQGNITNDASDFGYAYVTADGGYGSGNGGTLNLTATQGSIDFNNYIYLSAIGGDTAGSGPGGNGGIINLTGTGAGGSISNNYGNIYANGGYGSGNGGTVNLAAGSITDNFSIDVNGGNAANAGSAGGNGGTVNLTATQGDLNVNGSIYATTGANGNTTFPGGAGGAVNLVAQGAVNINANATIQVSSSDLVNNIVTSTPGNITVTSHLGVGSTIHAIPAINVASSAQLLSIVNQGAVGPSGNITFTADSGGDIVISGSVRSDHGTISMNNTYSGTAATNVAVTGANLSADVIKAQVLGNNGTLTIGSPGTNTSLTANTAILLYAQGSNGSVIFNGNASLNGSSIKSIAGYIVQINPTYTVNVSGGAATVYTTHANYTSLGVGNTNYGNFSGNGVTTQSFSASRPAF